MRFMAMLFHDTGQPVGSRWPSKGYFRNSFAQGSHMKVRDFTPPPGPQSEAHAKTHTSGHINCQACEEARAMSIFDFSADSIFAEASLAWFAFHSTYIKPNTRRVYTQHIKVLTEFLLDTKLGNIHIGTVRTFQLWRREKACPTLVNAEVSVLKMILQEANLWDRIGLLYHPLPVPKVKVRQNMSEDEEAQLMKHALAKPRRMLAGHCLLVMANTSMGFGELRNVIRGDVVLEGERPFIMVNGGAKNDYRIRSIPLNAVALRSVRWIIRRWEMLGGSSPDQYILPHNAKRDEADRNAKGHRRTKEPDFTTPMGHIYRAARAILKDAGLDHLDPYDMRSHAITKLLSDPNVSEQVYEEITGHKGRAMPRRYSKQRMEKKAIAMDRLCKNVTEDVPHTAQLIVFKGGKTA